MSELKPGDLVRIDNKPQVWRVVDRHSSLVRVAPTRRTGRIVHPDRLTIVEPAVAGSSS